MKLNVLLSHSLNCQLFRVDRSKGALIERCLHRLYCSVKFLILWISLSDDKGFRKFRIIHDAHMNYMHMINDIRSKLSVKRFNEV